MALRTGKCAALFLAVAALVAAPSVAPAAILGIDVNSTTVQARDAAGQPVFNGLLHTGTLQLTADATATLSDVAYDGATQNPTHVPVNVTGTINLDNGKVAAGSSVTMTFVNSPAGNNTLSFPLLPLGGQVADQAGFFKLIADMGTATFANGNPIGGVAISPWQTTSGGAFTLQHFAPEASGSSNNGFSNDVNLEVLVVPEPASVAVLGMAGLSLIGRRRRA
jgi:hypothetical protein